MNLANTSNVSTDTPGLWVFNIRNGSITTGETADTPLLPQIVTPEGYQFTFNVVLNQRVFVDPTMTTGYDFSVASGDPNFLTALFPIIAGDTDGFGVYLADGTFLGTAFGGTIFDFGQYFSEGVSAFWLRDIDIPLDVDNPRAFVTGFTFASEGEVHLTQTPNPTFDVPGAVPEPASWAMMLGGFGIVGAALRSRRRRMLAASFA